MTFHEKSALVCTVCILLVYIPYFAFIWLHPEAYIVFFIAATVGIIVLMASFHVAIALLTPSVLRNGDTPAHDEMDRLIEFRAAKVSGVFMAVVVMIWYLNALVLIPANAFIVDSEVVNRPESINTISISKALFAVHVLFAGFVVANLVYYISIIIGYRRFG